MSKAKKVTYKELMERNDFLLSRLLEVERAVNYTHTLTLAYIDCNDDKEKLRKFLEEVDKNEQADRSDTKGDRKDKSGDKDVKSKSK
jgi:hypothetical protein